MKLNNHERLGVVLMIAATASVPAAALYMMGLTSIPAIVVIAIMTLGSAIYSITGRT